jgi:tRNA threonylcarbamoyl adenosine modification protein YeaZ
MTDLSNTILAIDTAVLSGSLALFAGQKRLYSIDSGVSRSEVLIRKIDEVLRNARLLPQNLDSIAVSVGPGSFTGIRIGIATAFGLAKASSVVCYGVPVIDAISADPESEGRIPILPLGRQQYYVAGKVSGANSDFNSGGREILDEDLLIERILTCNRDLFLLPKPGRFDGEYVFRTFQGFSNVTFCRETIAELVCKSTLTGELPRNVSPIYAQR